MAFRDPIILRPGMGPPEDFSHSSEWFERKVGEFTLQTKLDSYLGVATGRMYVKSEDWTAWSDEIVRYFIEKGFRGPEIDGFIREHTLGTG